MSDAAKKKPEAHTAIGMHRTKFGWVSVTYTIEDGKITKTETTEPDLRAVALGQFLRSCNQFYFLD